MTNAAKETQRYFRQIADLTEPLAGIIVARSILKNDCRFGDHCRCEEKDATLTRTPPSYCRVRLKTGLVNYQDATGRTVN